MEIMTTSAGLAHHRQSDAVRAAVVLFLAIFSIVVLSQSQGWGDEVDSIQTGSLPGGGGATGHGRWISVPHEVPPGRLLVLGFAGDLGFSGKDQPLSTAGAVRQGRVIPWKVLFSGISKSLASDASFANLETVVMDRSDLAPVKKTFNFAAAPAALTAAVTAGINVLAVANNHAADFGAPGISETLRHLDTAKAAGLKVYAGLGKGDGRYRADVFDLGGISVGLAAIGKGINPAGAYGYGQPLYASMSDFDRVSRSLGNTRADVRVLSVHYGQELSLLPRPSDMTRLRLSIDQGDATIVFGHHSHVASGVERRGDGVIFYGLGNFMHAGTQDMTRYGRCRDFGLYARVYLWVSPGSRPVLRAVEVTPLRDMHEITRPFPPEEAAARISVVNAMSEELSRDGGGVALSFFPTGAGSGLACLPDQEAYGDPLAQRCGRRPGLFVRGAAPDRFDLVSCGPVPATDPPKASDMATQRPKRPTPADQRSDKSRDQDSKGAKKRPPRTFFLFSSAG